MNAVEMAMKMKKEAIRTYCEAAENCSHPAGKKMLQVILEDERHHLKSLEETVKKMKIDVTKLSPIKNVKSALESIKNEIRVKKACSLDDMEAFRLAMDMEKECVDFFKKQAAEAPSPAERALFEKLFHEEEEHFRIFANTHSYLDDTGNWFMWEDHSIVEG